MSTLNVLLKNMEVEKILMDIHQQIGGLTASVAAVAEDVRETKADGKETKKQAYATNGKVLRNIEDIKVLQTQLNQLKPVTEKPVTVKKAVEVTWQHIVLFLGGAATLIAFTIERLWK